MDVMAIDIGTPRLPLSDIVTWVRAMKAKPRPGSAEIYQHASLSDLTKSRLMAVSLAEANHGAL